MSNIISQSTAIQTALQSILDKALADFNNRIQQAVAGASQTPITVGSARRAGRSIGEQMTNGVVEGSSAVSESVIEQVHSVMNRSVDESVPEIASSVAAAYSYIEKVIEEAIDTNPVITPVLDLSQLQNGMNYANTMLGQAGFGANGVAYAQAMYPRTMYSRPDTDVQAQESTIDVIRGIRSDISRLGDAITNMQMVMDTGAVVGAITPSVDRALGSMQGLKERWA